MAASLWWDDASASSSGTRHTSTSNKNKHEDIFIFGYACKLFRDDEKAKDIDKGKLLIPWMGDQNLLIDRYDGRGHLYDLAEHDADFVANRTRQMTDQDAAVEKACEEERYLELHADLQEEAMYEEEEWKRYYLALQEGYQAVGFSYDQPQGESEIVEPVTDDTMEEKPFVAPEELLLPSHISQPTSYKQNARIEKTANFIAQQGIQMEIMVKTKQSGNSQFDFLHFEDELNPYYKHVVSMMKSGRYKYKPPQDEKTEQGEEKGDGDYLHPSLSSATQLPPPPPPPSKPIELPKVSIHDTPYGALIQSIKRNNITASEAEKVNISNQDTLPSVPHLTDPDPVDPPDDTGAQGYSYLVSSMNGPDLMERLYGPEPETHSPSDVSSHPKKRRRRSSSSDSSLSSSSSSSSSPSRSKSRRKKKRNYPRRPPRAEGPLAIVPPPPDIQPIVDRMALYVAKNGMEFEIVVQGRNDPRFQFLNEYHIYFPYYSQKREIFINELGKNVIKPEEKEVEEKSVKNGDSNQGAGARSVSFSIKAKAKESESGPSGKPKLFEYDSSEGEEGRHRDEQVSGPVSRSTSPPVKAQGAEETVKQMEEKLKDKLSNALKERISQSSKEKNLQAERKKKATMFLTMLKANKPQASPPSTTSSTTILEDSATLYVGEPASAIMYDYRHHPQTERSVSPRERHYQRRWKSPTPPSAYNTDRRSPTCSSPSKWQSRGNQWTSSRDKGSSWHRSRSPGKRDERKKKHKKSKSRSPIRRGRSKDRERSSKDRERLSKDKEKSKHSREKSKHKSKDKDRDRDKKKASNHTKSHSRDKEAHISGKRKRDPVKTCLDSGSDVEVLENLSSHPFGIHNNGKDCHSVDGDEGLAVKGDADLPTLDGVSLDKAKRLDILSLEARDDSLSRDSPSVSSQHEPKDGKSHLQTEATPTSSDFMTKVRAMLKKSREMIMKEEGFSLEDT